jgi:hypothetical protein
MTARTASNNPQPAAATAATDSVSNSCILPKSGCSQSLLLSLVEPLHDKHHRVDALQTSLPFGVLFRSNSTMTRLSTTRRRKTALPVGTEAGPVAGTEAGVVV